MKLNIKLVAKNSLIMATSVKTGKTAKPANKRDANGRFVAKNTTAVTGTGEYTLWTDIQKRYPDHFVLLENPVFRKDNPMEIEKGIFLYKSKDRGNISKAIQKENSPLHYLVNYTGGRLDELRKKRIDIL
ncbi:hypothetical protein FACS189430_10190 [Bacteroidia bacterium]|nr:hypothetical protein FACS189430_10190 [Bacteroidia bacterium]